MTKIITYTKAKESVIYCDDIFHINMIQTFYFQMNHKYQKILIINTYGFHPRRYTIKTKKEFFNQIYNQISKDIMKVEKKSFYFHLLDEINDY